MITITTITTISISKEVKYCGSRSSSSSSSSSKYFIRTRQL